MRVRLKDLDRSPKQIFWADTKDLYVPDKEVPVKPKNNKLVFTQACMHHPVYAYSSYLAILSLYASTDIEQYDIKVYVTPNLTALCEFLFAPFPKVEVIQYKTLRELRPDWPRADFDFNTTIKTQFWWDEKLRDYDVVCGLDADLFAVGSGGSFKKLESLQDGILLCPSGDPWEIFVHMTKHLNLNPDKNVFDRLDRTLGIKNLRKKIKSLPWWGNSSLHAFPTKYLKDTEFQKLLEFWFSEPSHCDESCLAIYSRWKDIPVLDVSGHLIDMAHYLEHHSLFNNKQKPMHLVDYPQSASITHRLSTHDSADQMRSRFQEYVHYVGDLFKRKYD
jgi:hypothetical protein